MTFLTKYMDKEKVLAGLGWYLPTHSHWITGLLLLLQFSRWSMANYWGFQRVGTIQSLSSLTL